MSKKYEKIIKFYYSTLDSQYAKYFTRILNIRHPELPVFLLIEKNNKEKNDFNKFKLAKAELSIESVEKFIEDYFAKKLKFFFVSQAQLDVTEENLNETLATLNGTATDAEMNKKYYNAGKNIYQIEGRHFETFLKDNLNKTVVMLACSFPMINCRNGLEKFKFVTHTFNKFLDQLIFVETDPNFNEYVVSVNNISDNNKDNDNNGNVSQNNNSDSTINYKFEDYYRYIFKPLYPQVVIFPAISQEEIEQVASNNLNHLIIKKLQIAIDFIEDFDTLKLIRFVGRNSKISPEELEIDRKFLIEEDVDGNINLTGDYDEDFLSEEELEKDRDLDARIEDLKEMLGPDTAGLIDMLKEQDPKQSKEIKKELLQAVEEINRKKIIEQEATTEYKLNEVNNLKEKDDL